MSDDKLKIRITSDTRKINAWVKGSIGGNIRFEAKVFDKPSKYGISKGRISKLGIRKDGEIIVNFDRGWDVKPTPEHRKLYDAVMARLNGLGLANEVENDSTLFDKLEAAKEKAALRDFDVTITETLQKTVTVTAKDQCEAELIVQDEWDNQEHIIDAEHFKGVTFAAVPTKPERARSGEER